MQREKKTLMLIQWQWQPLLLPYENILLKQYSIKTNNKGVLLSPKPLNILLTTLYPTIKIIPAEQILK